jgi:hypothetical protein
MICQQVSRVARFPPGSLTHDKKPRAEARGLREYAASPLTITHKLLDLGGVCVPVDPRLDQILCPQRCRRL